MRNKENKPAAASNRYPHYIKVEKNSAYTRSDIQYFFLKLLFSDENRVFTDPFPKSEIRIASEPMTRGHKLTFGELYRKTLANNLGVKRLMTSKLIENNHESRGCSMLFFLLSIHTLSGSLTFSPTSYSAQRLYHTIPCIQLDEKNPNKEPIIFPEANSLRTILSQCLKLGGKLDSISSLEDGQRIPNVTVLSFLDAIEDSEAYLNEKYFKKSKYGIYDLFQNGSLDPGSRVQLFLWLTYTCLETKLKNQKHKGNPFGNEPPVLKKAVYAFDIDTTDEVEFGENSKSERIRKSKGSSDTKTGKSKQTEMTSSKRSRGRSSGTSIGRPRGRPRKTERSRQVKNFVEEDDIVEDENSFDEESEISEDGSDGFEEWGEDEIDEDEDDVSSDEDEEEEVDDEVEKVDDGEEEEEERDEDTNEPSEQIDINVQSKKKGAGADGAEISKESKRPLHEIAKSKFKFNGKSNTHYKVIKQVPVEEKEDDNLSQFKRKKIEVQYQPSTPIKQLKKLQDPEYPMVDSSVDIDESLNELYTNFVKHYGGDAIGV